MESYWWKFLRRMCLNRTNLESILLRKCCKTLELLVALPPRTHQGQKSGLLDPTPWSSLALRASILDFRASTPSPCPLLLETNLRPCTDTNTFGKYVSSLYRKKYILHIGKIHTSVDLNRFTNANKRIEKWRSRKKCKRLAKSEFLCITYIILHEIVFKQNIFHD